MSSGINRLGNLPSRLATLLMAGSLLIAMMAGVASMGPSSALAANPVEFDAAQVTPADAQSFFALSFDPESAQLLQAQELLVRSGLMPEGVDLSEPVEEIMSPLGPAPELINPQAAMATQPTSFDLDALMGSVDTSEIGGLDPSSATSELDDVEIENLQGTTFVITADNIDEVAPFLQEQLRNEALKRGSSLATVEGPEGTEILAVEGVEDEAITDRGLVIRVMAVVEGAAIFATTVEDVLPFAETAAGLTPALADEADYQQAMAALPSDVLLGGYVAAVDAEQIAEIQSVLDEAQIPFSVDMIAEPTGPSGLAIWAAEDGFRFESAMLPAPEGSLASPEAAPLTSGMTMAERLSADTMLFVSGTDLGASYAFRALEQAIALLMLGSTDDDALGQVQMTEQFLAQQFAGLEMLLGFNLQTDFMRQLTGEFGFALSSIDPMDPTNIGAIFVSGVDDPDAVTSALNSVGLLLLQLAGEEAPRLEQVTVGDSSVNQITIPSEGFDAVVQYGVVQDEFVLAYGDSLLEYALGPADTLVDDPLYQEVMNALPEAQTSVAYINTHDLLQLAAFGAMVSTDTGASLLEDVSFDDSDSSLDDASERCAEFISQADAQEAYDADPVTNFDLDVDFDGVACDDFFDDVDAPAASPDTSVEIFDVNIGGFGAVGYEEDGISRMSGILVIPAED